jgi:putative oxidoreductase
MKNLITVIRIVFGLMWVVFGLNFFLQFLPMPPPKESMMSFTSALMGTGYFMQFVKITEITVGALLLLNAFVPLALVVIAPVSINILLLHFFLEPAGLPMAIGVVTMNAILGFSYFKTYKPMLKMKN